MAWMESTKPPPRPDAWVRQLPSHHSKDSRRRLVETLSPEMRKAVEAFPLYPLAVSRRYGRGRFVGRGGVSVLPTVTGSRSVAMAAARVAIGGWLEVDAGAFDVEVAD